MSEQLDSMKSTLMTCAASHMNDLEHVDAKELGEVIDMIKDLEEAKYYCTITKAMEDRSKTDDTQSKIDNALLMERLRNQAEGSQPMRNYVEPMYYYDPYIHGPYRGYEENGRMYYDGRDMRRRSYDDSGNNNTSSSNNNSERYYDGRDERRGGNGYTEKTYTSTMPSNIRDSREGRSYIGRRGYMESKESNMPDAVKMQKLEEYMHELSDDITDMIRGASEVEKTELKSKLTQLANKIS